MAANACDSCDWREVLRQYNAGELSTTRSSRLLDHEIRVSVLCDANRPVDVDDVFQKIVETETEFVELFGILQDPRQGAVPNDEVDTTILEVVVGICDYGGGIDDCVMYTLCAEDWGWGGCGVSTGKALSNTPREAMHTAFVPQLPEGEYWWNDSNIYKNLQHEYTHLLDYTYIRVNTDRGVNTDWWVEGLPQFIQWRILKDDLSWHRGNNNATMLDVFMHRANTRDYYDGMRMFAYLSENSTWLLEGIRTLMQSGVYTSAE